MAHIPAVGLGIDELPGAPDLLVAHCRSIRCGCGRATGGCASRSGCLGRLAGLSASRRLVGIWGARRAPCTGTIRPRAAAVVAAAVLRLSFGGPSLRRRLGRSVHRPLQPPQLLFEAREEGLPLEALAVVAERGDALGGEPHPVLDAAVGKQDGEAVALGVPSPHCTVDDEARHKRCGLDAPSNEVLLPDIRLVLQLVAKVRRQRRRRAATATAATATAAAAAAATVEVGLGTSGLTSGLAPALHESQRYMGLGLPLRSVV